MVATNDIKGIYGVIAYIIISYLHNKVYDWKYDETTAHVYSDDQYTDRVLLLEGVKTKEQVISWVEKFISESRIKKCDKYYIVHGNKRYSIIIEYKID